ncbi:uncharacterized protein LOC124113577 [Haliotis rufescens]|uniref:uncharacterized protein LOC124113577 n=1 Tax=Haliotis rufescens TaxID=6454 RepID=UPI00201F24A3|nr:uncharacterized protein LOC124113577 [Haliotis rufescens]
MSVLTEKQFTEALPSSLDLFELSPYQTSILLHYYVDVRPLSAITDTSPVEFLIPGAGSDYMDLAKTRLVVNLKVKHTDNTPLAAKEKVGPVNLLLASLWSAVSVAFQGQQVNINNAAYPYKAMFKTLLQYGADAKTSQLETQLFYTDNGDDQSDWNSVDPYSGGNDGLINRGLFIAKSKRLSLSGPLMEDVFEFKNKLVNGVDVGIKLFRSSVPFILMSDETTKQYVVELEDVYLKVCKLKVNNALIVAQSKQFESANALYPYMRSEMKVASVAASQMSYTWDNMYLNKCPSRLVVGMVRADAYNGSLTKNPFCFIGEDVEKVTLYLDGTPVPNRGLSPDDVEAYVNMYLWNNIWREDRGLGIKRNEFKIGNALFVFNLESASGDDDYLNLLKSGTLRLEVQFNKALTTTMNIVVMSQMPSLIEIDQTRNVFVK